MDDPKGQKSEAEGLGEVEIFDYKDWLDLDEEILKS